MTATKHLHLSMPDRRPGAWPAPLEMDKTVIRCGRYRAGRDGRTLEVTPQRLDRWVQAFERMRRAGVSVDVTLDHSPSAAAKLGEVTAMHRRGRRLILRHRFADPAAASIARRCGQVSIELDPHATDGHGRGYGEAVVASSLVRQPVVPAQPPFRPARITACAQPAPNADDYPFSTNTTKEPNAMHINQDQLDRLRELLGPDAPGDGAGVVDHAIATLADGAEATARLEDLLEQSRREIDRLQSEPAQAAPDPELLDQTAEADEALLDQLVGEGRITPAVRDRLAAGLLGQPGNRNALSLSRHGERQRLSRLVLDALRLNRPVDMSQLSGQQALVLEPPQRGPSPGALIDQLIAEANAPLG